LDWWLWEASFGSYTASELTELTDPNLLLLQTKVGLTKDYMDIEAIIKAQEKDEIDKNMDLTCRTRDILERIRFLGKKMQI
jgi:hypothetical protein